MEGWSLGCNICLGPPVMEEKQGGPGHGRQGVVVSKAVLSQVQPNFPHLALPDWTLEARLFLGGESEPPFPMIRWTRGAGSFIMFLNCVMTGPVTVSKTELLNS